MRWPRCSPGLRGRRGSTRLLQSIRAGAAPGSARNQAIPGSSAAASRRWGLTSARPAIAVERLARRSRWTGGPPIRRDRPSATERRRRDIGRHAIEQLVGVSATQDQLSMLARRRSLRSTDVSTRPAESSQKPATLSNAHGLVCRPSCAHVSVSKNSSSVPNPPGKVRNPSDRLDISALRRCMLVTRCSLVIPGCAISRVQQRTRHHADHLPAFGQRGVGQGAHQSDVAATVDEPPAAPRDRAARRRAPRRCRRGCRPSREPQKTQTESNGISASPPAADATIGPWRDSRRGPGQSTGRLARRRPIGPLSQACTGSWRAFPTAGSRPTARSHAPSARPTPAAPSAGR